LTVRSSLYTNVSRLHSSTGSLSHFTLISETTVLEETVTDSVETSSLHAIADSSKRLMED